MSRPNVRAFKSAKAAQNAANGAPVVRVGPVYIVGLEGIDQVELIAGRCPETGRGARIAGQVGLAHLDRLGNANHAVANTDWNGPADKAPVFYALKGPGVMYDPRQKALRYEAAQ